MVKMTEKPLRTVTWLRLVSMGSFHLPALTPAPVRAAFCVRGPIPSSEAVTGCEVVVAGLCALPGPGALVF